MRKYNIITLCGSTQFKDEFIRVQKELTLQGNIVISVGLFGHSGDDEVWDDGVKEMLDDMHLAKIDLPMKSFLLTSTGTSVRAQPGRSHMPRHAVKKSAPSFPSRKTPIRIKKS